MAAKPKRSFEEISKRLPTFFGIYEEFGEVIKCFFLTIREKFSIIAIPET